MIHLTEALIRTAIAFATLYFICRILGKKLISRMTLFDFVAGITIGGITANIIFDKTVPLKTGILVLTFFCLLTLFIDILTWKLDSARKIFNGSPTLLIKNGNILHGGMNKERLTHEELLHLLRKSNVFHIDEVDMAFFETDGTLSVSFKQNNMPLTKSDADIYQRSRGIPQTFILDGKIVEECIQDLRKDTDWVMSILATYNISTIEEVGVAQIDQLGKITINLYDD